MFLVLLAVSPSVSTGQDNDSTGDDVDQWIEKLGDDRFIVRSNAASELQRIGLRAFDRLYEAQYHRELEIGIAARRLISNLMTSWSLPEDSKDVRQALDQYSRQSKNNRRGRIELLAGLPDRGGTPALTRLVRYEKSAQLSAFAATEILKQTPSEDLNQRQNLATEILRIIEGSERISTRWIACYANDLLASEFNAPAWEQLIDDRRQKVDSAATDQASRESVLKLVQVVAAHAGRMDAKPAAVKLVMKHLDLISPQTASLIDSSTWAIDHDLYEVVDRLRERFEPLFSDNALLSYSAAEAALRQGKEALGQQLASEASKLPPIPEPEKIESLQPRQLQLLLMRHSFTAARLHSRGLYRWSLREFQLVIDAVPLSNPTAISCRAQAASLLSDMNEHAKVVAILEPLIDRVDKDRDLRQLSILQDQFDSLAALLEYHQGELLIAQGDIDKGCEALEQAYAADTDNVDILIRMYHIQRDDAWHAEVVKKIQNQVRKYELIIAQGSGRLNWQMMGGMSDPVGAYNNYAWLVSNTEGDYEKALKYSLLSVQQTDPDNQITAAERMDTCARCYFALGQIGPAIAMQKRAIKRMPHNVLLLRQLKTFEEARDRQEKEDGQEANNESEVTTQ